MAQCPKCKSENVSVQMMTTDAKTKKYSTGFGGKLHNTGRALLAIGTLGISNDFVRARLGEEETKIGSKKIYICQSCGYSSDGRDFIGSTERPSVQTGRFSPDDPTVRKAIEICVKQGKFSPALLQTWLGKGCEYVTNLGVWLADNGIIETTSDFKKPSNVLITSLDEFDQIMKPGR